VLGASRLEAEAFGHERQRELQTGRHPAAVPSGGAETGDIAFDDGDIERWIALLQIIGGPESGIAGTQYGDVDVNRAVERRSRRQIVAAGIEPVAITTIFFRHLLDLSSARSAPFRDLSVIESALRVENGDGDCGDGQVTSGGVSSTWSAPPASPEEQVW
jgi:hypothetical protein